ncbi:MAG: hypothetical protein ABGY41_14380, partial [Candidatus Poribacteria bacterium]
MPALYGRPYGRYSRRSSGLLSVCIGLLVAVAAGAAPLAEPADPSLPIRGDNWALFLEVAASGDAGAESVNSPWFGVSPTSTDAFDRFQDFIAPPPTPFAGRPSAHLENLALSGDFQTLIADFRAFPSDPFAELVWTLVVDNPSEADWVLSWDSAGIPRLWAAATIDDGSSAYDMRATSVISVPAGAETRYDITLSRAAVGAPVDPPGVGLFGLLRAGQMLSANVPNAVYGGLPLFLTSDPVDGNPTDVVVLPAGFAASETSLMRDVRITRDGVDLTDFSEPVEIELAFDDGDIPDG